MGEGRRAKGRLAAALSVAAVIMCAGPATADASVTESTTLTASVGTLGSHQGQTFTVPAAPTSDNFLHTLQILDYTRNATAATWRIYVSAVDASGFPTGAPLFQSPLVSGQQFNRTVYTVYPNLMVTPDQKYAWFTESTPGNLVFGGSATDVYSGGAAVAFNTATSSWFANSGASGTGGVDIAFRAQFSAGKGATTTSLSGCPSSTVIGFAVSCTVTVANPGTGLGTPTGAVGFSAVNGDGAFSGCGSLNGSGQCTMTYTPSSNTSGTHTVFAQYAGDATHLASSTNTSLSVSRRASAQSAIGCAPTTLNVGQTATCSVNVTDQAVGTKTSPTGATTWTSTGPGSFSPSNACPVIPTGTLGSSSCNAIVFTPTAAGSHQIVSTYSGDGDHLPSNPLTAGTLTVLPNPGVAGTSPPDCTALRTELKRLKRKLRKAVSRSAKSKLRSKISKTRRRLAQLGC